MTKPAIRIPAALQHIPPLPQVAIQAMELIRDPGSSRTTLARVLSLDQGMTGRFLHMVNSAYYGLPRRITSLDEAIGFLGYERVNAAIVAAAANRYLTQPLPAYSLEGGMLWRHAVAVATGSEWIARRRDISPSSEAYVAGLLHDVGKLALDIMLDHRAEWPDDGGEEDDTETWTEVERYITGHDHPELGAAIARGWNLPDRVVEAIACHHRPSEATLDPRMAAAVHVANAAALMAGIGLGVDGLCYILDMEAIECLHWSDDEMGLLIEGMQVAVQNAEAILGMRP
jgi:putative nucleotidyltransferase with HDIG domain